MAAAGYVPGQSRVTTGAGGGATTHNHTVPGGKRWIFDIVDLESTVQNAGNTATFQEAANPLLDAIGNFLKIKVDLNHFFPRSLELEAGGVFRVVWARAAATAVTSTINYQEKDL